MAFRVPRSKDIAFNEPNAVEIEKGENTSNVSDQQPAAWEQFPEANRKKVLLKMDLRILPIVMILYSKYSVYYLLTTLLIHAVLSYMDRANIGNAKIEVCLMPFQEE
jgi:hypothetical protein